MAKLTRLILPVLVGPDWAHTMADVSVVEEPDQTTVTLVIGKGHDHRKVAEFLTTGEAVAVSLTALPVRNRQEKKETT